MILQKDNAKYSFAWKAKADGLQYGADSNERGYGKSYGGAAAEFGHAETRDYGKTTGTSMADKPQFYYN